MVDVTYGGTAHLVVSEYLDIGGVRRTSPSDFDRNTRKMSTFCRAIYGNCTGNERGADFGCDVDIVRQTGEG
ncbi:hypothetical protein KW792_00725 [Candidatus Saccharibacteria bacterium]|nr:hypothetical protein [Candidatus Saccharibacteria bacterium]